mgnify:CR=1 FL=1
MERHRVSTFQIEKSTNQDTWQRVWNKTYQPLNEMEVMHNRKFHTVIGNSLPIGMALTKLDSY